MISIACHHLLDTAAVPSGCRLAHRLARFKHSSIEEEDDLLAEGDGELRESIITGTNSPACTAAVSSMAIICREIVLRPLLTKRCDAHT